MPLPNDDDSPAVPSNAITPLPVSFKPRRRRPRSARPSLFERRGSGQRKQAGTSSQPLSADDLAVAALSGLTDTHVAIQTLHSQWPDEARNQLPCTPPIILRSQIHALVADSAAIEHELNKLISNEIICHIRVPCTPASSSDPSFRRDAYVMLDDLRVLQASYNTDSTFQSFVRSVVPRVRNGLAEWHVFESAFYQRCPQNGDELNNNQTSYTDHIDNAVNQLVRGGFLRMHDEHTYSLSVPGLAVFDENRTTGQKHVLRELKGAQYNELPLSKLELQTIKKSAFTAQWRVRDIAGSGIAHTVSTTVGPLVRMSTMSHR